MRTIASMSRRWRARARRDRIPAWPGPQAIDAWRLLGPMARVDGAPLPDQTGTTPAFLGHLDEPVAPEISSFGLPIVRVRGWVVSTRGKRLRVRVGLQGRLVDIAVDRSRPEVAEALVESFGALRPECGFSIDVVVPEPEDGDDVARLVIEVDDGDVAASRVCHVNIGSRRAPPRADYKATWDATANEVDSAKVAVLGSTDEDVVRRTAAATLGMLEHSLGIRSSDEVCEIGCGVGRVGEALALRCRRWVGCDVSGKMLAHARRRLRDFDNIELVEVSGWDLAPIPSSSLDVVYCTTVFMHLDEWERWSYVREARRVLRPGGRFYVDNINLGGEEGWALFLQIADLHPLARPPNVSKSSTPDELGTYLRRAGFADVTVDTSGEMWVYAVGRAP